MQDKENKHTPVTDYASSRLGHVSPAFQTPARTGHALQATAHTEGATACMPSNIDAHAATTPSAGTALTHVTPSVIGCGHSTPTFQATSENAVLPLRAFGGSEKGRTRLGHPAHSTLLPGSTCEPAGSNQLVESGHGQVGVHLSFIKHQSLHVMLPHHAAVWVTELLASACTFPFCTNQLKLVPVASLRLCLDPCKIYKYGVHGPALPLIHCHPEQLLSTSMSVRGVANPMYGIAGKHSHKRSQQHESWL